MKGLKKIWFCPDCEFFFVTSQKEVAAKCPICDKPTKHFVPSRILEDEGATAPIDEIELGNYHFKFIKKIGAGGFGIIYMVKDDNNNYYAMKLPKSFIDLSLAVNKKSSLDTHTRKTLVRQNDAINREVKVISKHYFNGMMPLIDYGNFTYGDETIDFFIQELGYISLAEFLEWSMQKHSLKKWDTRYWIAYQVAKAVAEAHANNVLLRDLSTENVMLSINETNGIDIHLIDFGGAKTDTLSSMLVYRNLYVPPMLLNEKGKKRDVFNLGVLLYEIMSNRPHWVNLVGELSDFQEDEFHRILSNFNDEIITPYLNSVPESEYRRDIINVLKKATKIGNDGRYLGYEDAQALLKDLPAPTHIPVTSGKVLNLDITMTLKNSEETQEVLIIDKYLHLATVKAENVAFIVSRNYKVKVLSTASIIHNKDERTIFIDIPFQELHYLPMLNARLNLKFKVEVSA